MSRKTTTVRVSARILFLDFDGVLHPNLCSENQRFDRVPLLEAALARREVRIVISSSWRFHYPYRSLVARFPAALRPLFAGCTGDPFVGEHARYHEIRHWLGANAPTAHWRALDDAAFEFPERCPQLIRCDGAVGVTPAEISRLQRWLAAK